MIKTNMKVNVGQRDIIGCPKMVTRLQAGIAQSVEQLTCNQ